MYVPRIVPSSISQTQQIKWKGYPTVSLSLYFDIVVCYVLVLLG